MEKRTKIIIILALIFILSIFIYNYACTKFGSQISIPGSNSTPFDCLDKIAKNQICPDCTTPMINGNIMSCPNSTANAFCIY